MTLPKDFEEYTRSILGPSRYDHLVAALTTDPPVSLRLNTTKQKDITGLNDRVPWCATGFYLASRPAFTFDPLLHAGVYYGSYTSLWRCSTSAPHPAESRQLP